MSQKMNEKRPEVVWIDADTGEVKVRAYKGKEPIIWSKHAPHNDTGEPLFLGEYDDWESTALEMALACVPDLEVAFDRARIQGRSVEVRVRVVPDE